jgi:hypothetical protein
MLDTMDNGMFQLDSGAFDGELDVVAAFAAAELLFDNGVVDSIRFAKDAAAAECSHSMPRRFLAAPVR